MKRCMAIVVCCCLVAAAPAQEVSGPRRSRAAVYGGEFAAALGGTVVCAAAGVALVGAGLTLTCTYLLLGLLFEAAGAPWPGWPVAAGLGIAVVGGGGAVLLAPYASGMLAWRAGREMGEKGARWGSVGGAYAALPVAAGLVVVGIRTADPLHKERSWPFYVAAGLAIPAGATIGYNLSSEPLRASATAGGRVLSPSVTLTRVDQPDGSVSVGVSLRLLDLRF